MLRVYEKNSASTIAVLVGTRKGAFFLRSDAAKNGKSTALIFGSIVHHAVLDPAMVELCLRLSDWALGPTIQSPPILEKNGSSNETACLPQGGQRKRAVVDHTFLADPGTRRTRCLVCGTSPQGLFRSEDGGMTWGAVSGFNDHPDRLKWIGGEQDMTPDGGKMHSILIDPRNANQMYLGLSGGGFFETKDKGRSWKRLNKGCDRAFDGADPDDGHDPHCVQIHPANPDRLYMQNHCGIYRLDRPSDT